MMNKSFKYQKKKIQKNHDIKCNKTIKIYKKHLFSSINQTQNTHAVQGVLNTNTLHRGQNCNST